MTARRTVLLGLAALLAMPSGALAQGRDIQDRIIEALRDQGYDRIEVGRTFLGRVRIEADGPPGEREIIFNPRTGEILRDLWRERTGAGDRDRLLDRDDYDENDDREDDDEDDDRDDDGDDRDDDSDDDSDDDRDDDDDDRDDDRDDGGDDDDD